MNNDIPSKTDIIDPNRNSFGRGGHAFVGRYNSIITYNIYVRVNDMHKANEIVFHDK